MDPTVTWGGAHTRCVAGSSAVLLELPARDLRGRWEVEEEAALRRAHAADRRQVREPVRAVGAGRGSEARQIGGETAHACVDAATFRPTRVPAWLADAIAAAEATA